MQLTLQYDSSVASAPVGFITALRAAANLLDAIITNPINMTIQIGYGEDDGVAIAGNTLAEAQPSTGVDLTYSQLVTDLTKVATSTDAKSFLASLPTADPANGGLYFVSIAQEKAWGLISPTSTEIDGYAGFSSAFTWDFNPGNGVAANAFDLVGVAFHELTHALGRIAPAGFNTVMDLLGYGANGQLDPVNGTPRYLSVNGGKTDLVSFDTSSDPGDFALGSPIDPLDAYLSEGQVYAWTALDSRLMNLLGFNVGAPPASPNDTVILPDGGAIEDANGNTWSISSGFQVLVNGTADPTAAPAAQLDYVNGAIWQQSLSGLWSSKILPTGAWSATVSSPPIAPPAIWGTVANQIVTPGASTRPFSLVSITDAIVNASDLVTITEKDAAGNSSDTNGKLTGPGLTETAPGVYQLAASSPSSVSSAIQKLLFTPANPAPATQLTTTFRIAVTDQTAGLLGGPVTADDTTSVVEQRVTPPAAVSIIDTTYDQILLAGATPYTGPVPGLQEQYINITPDNLNITAESPNWFLHTGSGEDAITAQSGVNVLDGGTGSNFLTGGTGQDTFFVDDRGPTADIWSTVNNFHAGDAATVFGVTPSDFTFSWMNGQGAPGYTGLTVTATAAGKPNASLTLVGFSTADLAAGRLSISYGVEPDGSGSYMYIKAS